MLSIVRIVSTVSFILSSEYSSYLKLVFAPPKKNQKSGCGRRDSRTFGAPRVERVCREREIEREGVRER